MRKFIIIDFEIFTKEKLPNIGTDGFALYCYLASSKGILKTNYTEMKYIKSFFKGVDGFSDNRTINKNLDNLHKYGIIKINRVGNLIEYEINEDIKQFLMFPVDVFENEIGNIGCIGFTLLCLLSKLHNNSYGSITSEGFSNPSQEYLAMILGIHRMTVIKYMELLERQKFIKREVQELRCEDNDYGGKEFQRHTNHYFVQHILNERNKYYIKQE